MNRGTVGDATPVDEWAGFWLQKNKVCLGTADVDLIVCGPGLFVTASGFINNVRIGIPFVQSFSKPWN